MRWNNYGVGLLDAQQYEASVAAFERVAASRPRYADAYINIAIVEMAWGRFGDAKTSLAKALTLSPGDPRAVYYRALTESNAGKMKEAIADLKATLIAYPRFRDGLRELGLSYFQMNDYSDARAIFERLQAIDPDDLVAHKTLASIYHRLGESEKAAIETAKYLDQKDDPSARVYTQEFLDKHPEVEAETFVWHTHDLTADPIQYRSRADVVLHP
jgi:Tfp pilus assembly protein PilF